MCFCFFGSVPYFIPWLFFCMVWYHKVLIRNSSSDDIRGGRCCFFGCYDWWDGTQTMIMLVRYVKLCWMFRMISCFVLLFMFSIVLITLMKYFLLSFFIFILFEVAWIYWFDRLVLALGLDSSSFNEGFTFSHRQYFLHWTIISSHCQLNYAQIINWGIFFVEEILVHEFGTFVAGCDPWDNNLVVSW